MDDKEIKNYIGNDTLTVSEAMQKIDKNTRGILFITNKIGELIGCVTDGDIRRYLLSGGKMDGPAIEAANKHPRVAHSFSEAKSVSDDRDYVIIPIIDNGIIVDIFFRGEITQRRKNPVNLPVVINAGGRGTRLDPYTRVLPKPLIPVGDLPIIELIMKEYQTYQCNDFHIIVNYKRELMKAYFAENDNQYHITWYDEDEPLGSGGALSMLKGKFTDTFFFANCDALLTADYDKIVDFHKQNGNAITMICAYKNMMIPYGIVEMGKNGSIEQMREKPVMSFLTNTGIYIVEPEVAYDVEEGVPIGFPDIVEMERKRGKKVAVFPVSENDWMDMGQISELEKMREKLYGE